MITAIWTETFTTSRSLVLIPKDKRARTIATSFPLLIKFRFGVCYTVIVCPSFFFFSCSAMLWHYKTTDRRRPNGIMPLTNFFVRTPQLNVSLHLTTNKAPQRRSIVGWIETDFFEWLFTVKAWN